MDECFIHPQAICESDRIGAGTRVWAFVHILPGAAVGVDCNICDHVFVENDVIIGNRVTVKSGVQLWDGVRLENDVFVGPNATFTNDKFPRSKQYPERFLHTVVEQGASIGANATILPGIRIGARAMVGAGAVVTHDVPPKAIISGNPAVISGYVDTPVEQSSETFADMFPTGTVSGDNNRSSVGIGNAAIYRLKFIRDLRGSLTVAEFHDDLPFVPARLFMVYDVPSSDVRGEHAHRECEQFLIAMRGSLSIVLDDGKSSREVRLDTPVTGVYIPPMIWGIQYKFTEDAVLLVLASQPYCANDYIRDYAIFQELTEKA
ncbi:MAG: WxcM-like domain-containing protein [Gammaproteobacteria bacterium]|nr:WxcM-like domain-containing protein [Gammaproteobacteria bacterium]